jgi:predicted dehydrogenase
MRAAFVGCGRFSGSRIYPSLKPAGLDLVAVCGRSREKTEARAAAYGIDAVFYDPVEMCRAVNPDVILVVAGPQGHYEIGRQLIPLGRPVWMEKPCAENAEQAEELARLAREAGVHVQVGFNYPYSLGIQKAANLIASGAFSSPAMVSVYWGLGEPDTRRFLLHYACHAVQLLHALTPGGLAGRMPEHVAHERRDGLDWIRATFRSPSGCIATLELSAQMPGPGHWSRVELHGKSGLLAIRDFTEVTFHEAAPWGALLKPGGKGWDGDRIWRTEPILFRESIEHAMGYVPELACFREIAQGHRPPEATIEDAAWGMRVLDRLSA